MFKKHKVKIGSYVISGVFYILILWMTPVALASTVDSRLIDDARAVLIIREKLCEKGTRADVFQSFKTDGGVQNEKNQVFVYKLCPYIKMRVKFTIGPLGQSDSDIISSISKLYLEDPVLD